MGNSSEEFDKQIDFNLMAQQNDEARIALLKKKYGMTEENVFEKINSVMVKRWRINKNEVTPESKINDYIIPGDRLSFIISIENEFKIHFPGYLDETAITIMDIVKAVPFSTKI